MEGNPICVRIPWDKNPEALAKWAEAKTGFPWIDAIMTQLRQEGWIHHLARHAVACFLTRGDLWISWEEGMKVKMQNFKLQDWVDLRIKRVSVLDDADIHCTAVKVKLDLF